MVADEGMNAQMRCKCGTSATILGMGGWRCAACFVRSASSMTRHLSLPKGRTIFLDGTGITPGSEKCNCGPLCEMPCWQRIGWAPACDSCGCPPFPDAEDEEDA